MVLGSNKLPLVAIACENEGANTLLCSSFAKGDPGMNGDGEAKPSMFGEGANVMAGEEKGNTPLPPWTTSWLVFRRKGPREASIMAWV